MSALDDIKLYVFHHHHYLDIPENHEDYKTSMIDYPNALYDPRSAATSCTTGTCGRCVRAEELGFDGIAINEHHNDGLQHDARARA